MTHGFALETTDLISMTLPGIKTKARLFLIQISYPATDPILIPVLEPIFKFEYSMIVFLSAAHALQSITAPCQWGYACAISFMIDYQEVREEAVYPSLHFASHSNPESI